MRVHELAAELNCSKEDLVFAINEMSLGFRVSNAMTELTPDEADLVRRVVGVGPEILVTMQETLANNLALARQLNEVSQTTLARLAGVSRATIAQMEGGESDPKLSTLVRVAAALKISPLLLLMSAEDLQALATGSDQKPLLSAEEAIEAKRLFASGLKKKRSKAVKLVRDAANKDLESAARSSATGAMLGAALLPRGGAVVGAMIATIGYERFKRFLDTDSDK